MDLFSCLSPFVFCSFASGSSGNCYYVGKQDEGLLVDAGIGMAQIKRCLGRIDLQLSQIKAILITHDHIDHIKGLEATVKAIGVPVFAHAECLKSAAMRKIVKNIGPELFRPIDTEQSFEICDIHIESFPVMHDGNGTLGYHFRLESRTLTIATDVGALDAVVKRYLKKSDSIVLEANYDSKMLHDGNYPYVLKQRVSGPFGHLSNDEAGRCIAELYRSDIKNIMLCHLSKNNNLPELAVRSVYQQLRRKHIAPSPNVSIFPLPRLKQTELIYL